MDRTLGVRTKRGRLDNVRIVSTPLAGLKPMGESGDRDFSRLTSYVRSIAGAPEDVAHLFAEPVPSRDNTRIDWYGPGGRSYEPLAAAAEDIRQQALARVATAVAALKAEGDRLRASGQPVGDTLLNATSLPDDDGSCVLISRDLANPDQWYPVLVLWAYAREGSALIGSAPQVLVRSTLPAVPSQAAPVGPVATGPVATGPAIAASVPVMLPLDGPNWGWLRLLLWLLLAILLLAIGWLMLKACGVALPGERYAFFGTAACPAPALASTRSEQDRARDLEAQLRELQLAVAQRRVVCERQAALQRLTPTPTIDDRLRGAGARSGKLQVSLGWDGPSDLDLAVFCPDGNMINHGSRTACGGSLDIDMNFQTKSMTPVEHVVWPGGAPAGRYRVVVRLYDRHGDARPTIPFVVQVRNGSETKTFRGQAGPETRAQVNVAEFDI